MKMDSQLELKLLCGDPSRIWVSACNGTFAGFTEQFVAAAEIESFKAGLDRFPQSVDAEVVLSVGDVHSVGGHCFLKFHCIDATGHTAVGVSLESEICGNQPADSRGRASFRIRFEAHALDLFVVSLDQALRVGSGTAVLHGLVEPD